jgi:rod shape-determining protein MreD
VSKIIYLMMCFVIDTLLNSIFPIDYSSVRMSFISNMGIIGLMFVSRELSFKDSLIFAFLFGILIDTTHYAYFLMFALSFTITILIVRVWANQINNSLPEIVILGILTIFVKEVVVFIIIRVLGISSMSFLTWFTSRQFLTLIGNIPLIVVAYFAYDLKNRFEINKDRARRKNEKTLWMKVSNPFE